MQTLETLLTLGALERLPRTGWLTAGVADPESVAAHALGTALVALVLGPRVDPPLDVDRVVTLAVVHDAPEALLTDLPRSATELLPEGAKRAAERAGARRLFEATAPEALLRWNEFAAGETREARFARLCDRLHLGVQLVQLLRRGQRGLEDFRAGLTQLDASEFPPCAELLRAILEASDPS